MLEITRRKLCSPLIKSRFTNDCEGSLRINHGMGPASRSSLSRNKREHDVCTSIRIAPYAALRGTRCVGLPVRRKHNGTHKGVSHVTSPFYELHPHPPHLSPSSPSSSFLLHFFFILHPRPRRRLRFLRLLRLTTISLY